MPAFVTSTCPLLLLRKLGKFLLNFILGHRVPELKKLWLSVSVKTRVLVTASVHPTWQEATPHRPVSVFSNSLFGYSCPRTYWP